MISRCVFVVFASFAFASPTLASGMQDEQNRPAAITELLACSEVRESPARLICYDAATTAFKAAQSRGEIAVVDRKEVDIARNRLFGLDGGAFPNLFGGGGDSEGLGQIETTLVRAVETSDGTWTFTLENGTVWRQIDSQNAYVRRQPGQPVRIRRAAMGSYLMNVGDARALRVRRQ